MSERRLTQRDVVRAIRIWAKRLGLLHWNISVDFGRPASDGADASTWRSDTYDNAVIYLEPEWRDWPLELLNRLVVHELLHLQTRDLDALVDDAREQLPRAASRQVEARYTHEIEGLVDRLACHIVGVGGVA